MSIAYLGEKTFLDEVNATGQVWVARGFHRNVYAMELDATGLSLPVWSSRDKAADFLKHAQLVGPHYEPYPVPVDVFTAKWLSDRTRDITELQINPDGITTRVLILTNEEFVAARAVP